MANLRKKYSLETSKIIKPEGRSFQCTIQLGSYIKAGQGRLGAEGPPSKAKGTDVREAAGHRGSGCHGGAHEMRAPATPLPPLEVAVGRRQDVFKMGKNVPKNGG